MHQHPPQTPLCRSTSAAKSGQVASSSGLVTIGGHGIRGRPAGVAPAGPTDISGDSPLIYQLAASGVLARVDDLEVLVDEDLELLAVGGLDVRLVRRARVAVRLGPDDRRAGYLARTAASTFCLVSPVSAVSPPRPPGPRPPRLPPGPPRPRSAWTAVASNDEFTSTTWSVPPDVRMWAWYGESYGPAALGAQHGRAGHLGERGGLDLRGHFARQRLALRRAVCGVAVLSAAPATAAPPKPSAPSAATVTADLRMVLSTGCFLRWLGCGT